MRILFIGDIVGKPGRLAVKKVLPKLKKTKKIDLVIANVENLAHGKGLTQKTWAEIQAAGVGFGTGGNHTFSKPDANVLLADPSSNLIRPANYTGDLPGTGAKVIEIKKAKILVLNLGGQAFMIQDATSPFAMADLLLTKFKTHITIVDMHGEATSEKVALGWHLAGRVTAVIGTHTHVPTADTKILPGPTAYVTDAGMCGLRDGIIGVDREVIMPRFLAGEKIPHQIAEHGAVVFNSVLIETNAKNQAVKISRLDKEFEV
jgi:metallophosphoesterase (TIGR00282 family)